MQVWQRLVGNGHIFEHVFGDRSFVTSEVFLQVIAWNWLHALLRQRTGQITGDRNDCQVA